MANNAGASNQSIMWQGVGRRLWEARGYGSWAFSCVVWHLWLAKSDFNNSIPSNMAVRVVLCLCKHHSILCYVVISYKMQRFSEGRRPTHVKVNVRQVQWPLMLMEFDNHSVPRLNHICGRMLGGESRLLSRGSRTRSSRLHTSAWKQIISIQLRRIQDIEVFRESSAHLPEDRC
jgi:hypothetical protein